MTQHQDKLFQKTLTVSNLEEKFVNFLVVRHLSTRNIQTISCE